MWSLVWCPFKWSVDQRSTLVQAIRVCRTRWYNPLHQHLVTSGGGGIASVGFFRWATDFIAVMWMGPGHLQRAHGGPGVSGMTSFTFSPRWSLSSSARVFLLDLQPIADWLCSLTVAWSVVQCRIYGIHPPLFIWHWASSIPNPLWCTWGRVS